MAKTPVDLTSFSLTCPSCGGGIKEIAIDAARIFSCHIGHSFSAAEFEVAQVRSLDYVLSAALRALNERAGLFERFAQEAHGRGKHDRAARWSDLRQEVEVKTLVLERLIHYGWGVVMPD
jgi:two-component system chemotaxis response regulator CheB